jgi:hypothetical protein
MDLRLATSDRLRPERPAPATAGPADAVAQSGGPSGVLHGYEPGTDRTLCGRPLRELYDWPGVTWPRHWDDDSVCDRCKSFAYG